jgi:hypothetical protein
MESGSSTHNTAVSNVRRFDWRLVVSKLDELPSGTVVLVGVMDQSIRTHIKNGRISYLDPSLYDVWTEAFEGSRTKARLFMRKRQ